MSGQIERLEPRELRLGDILMCRGSARLGSTISEWICALDGGRYSHAALWDGEAVLEASGSGGKVRAADLGELIAEHEYTHVHRFRTGATGGEPPLDLAPVIEVARARIGAGYPYAELCLLGVLIGLGRTTGLPCLQELLRTRGATLAQALRELKQHVRSELPMTCSQLIGMAFWEADPSPARRYALEVPYRAFPVWRSAHALELSSSDREQLRALRELARDVLIPEPARTRPGWSRELARGARTVRSLGIETELVRAGDGKLPNICVTPRDLECSPSLTCVGELRA